mmetsp:Transcript_4409/g.8504  ORF Transcript_4409/g.8504 Transcript_4409/m.8504 type:complete len:90 (-) Transcript_4409:186-455(-)
MAIDGLFRYQLFCLYTFAFLGLWIVLKTEAADNPMVTYAPLWLVVGIGLFAAFSILSGVANLEDCPAAAKEVERDIQEAKIAMKKKGII